MASRICSTRQPAFATTEQSADSVLPHHMGRESRPARATSTWSAEEDELLLELMEAMGGPKRWAKIAQDHNSKMAHLGKPLRSAKSCRLRWYNQLRPGVNHGALTPEEQHIIEDAVRTMGTKWARIVTMLPGRTDNAIKNWWYSKHHERKYAGCSRKTGGSSTHRPKASTSGSPGAEGAPVSINNNKAASAAFAGGVQTGAGVRKRLAAGGRRRRASSFSDSCTTTDDEDQDVPDSEADSAVGRQTSADASAGGDNNIAAQQGIAHIGSSSMGCSWGPAASPGFTGALLGPSTPTQVPGSTAGEARPPAGSRELRASRGGSRLAQLIQRESELGQEEGGGLPGAAGSLDPATGLMPAALPLALPRANFAKRSADAVQMGSQQQVRGALDIQAQAAMSRNASQPLLSHMPGLPFATPAAMKFTVPSFTDMPLSNPHMRPPLPVPWEAHHERRASTTDLSRYQEGAAGPRRPLADAASAFFEAGMPAGGAHWSTATTAGQLPASTEFGQVHHQCTHGFCASTAAVDAYAGPLAASQLFLNTFPGFTHSFPAMSMPPQETAVLPPPQLMQSSPAIFSAQPAERECLRQQTRTGMMAGSVPSLQGDHSVARTLSSIKIRDEVSHDAQGVAPDPGRFPDPPQTSLVRRSVPACLSNSDGNNAGHQQQGPRGHHRSHSQQTGPSPQVRSQRASQLDSLRADVAAGEEVPWGGSHMAGQVHPQLRRYATTQPPPSSLLTSLDPGLSFQPPGMPLMSSLSAANTPRGLNMAPVDAWSSGMAAQRAKYMAEDQHCPEAHVHALFDTWRDTQYSQGADSIATVTCVAANSGAHSTGVWPARNPSGSGALPGHLPVPFHYNEHSTQPMDQPACANFEVHKAQSQPLLTGGVMGGFMSTWPGTGSARQDLHTALHTMTAQQLEWLMPEAEGAPHPQPLTAARELPAAAADAACGNYSASFQRPNHHNLDSLPPVNEPQAAAASGFWAHRRNQRSLCALPPGLHTSLPTTQRTSTVYPSAMNISGSFPVVPSVSPLPWSRPSGQSDILPPSPMKISATYSALDCPLDDLVGLLCNGSSGGAEADAQLVTSTQLAEVLLQPSHTQAP